MAPRGRGGRDNNTPRRSERGWKKRWEEERQLAINEDGKQSRGGVGM